MYLRIKFQVSSTVLTGFRHGSYGLQKEWDLNYCKFETLANLIEMAKTDLNLLIQGHNSQLLVYIYNKTNK